MPATTSKRRRPPTWRAGDDRIAHAHERHALRTLCGERIVLERLEWPAHRRCMGCEQLVREALA